MDLEISRIEPAQMEAEPVRFRPALSPAGLPARKVTCARCHVRETCLAGGMDADFGAQLEYLVSARFRIKRGQRLFGAGSVFAGVYAIRSGFFKTTVLDGQGREQINGFLMGAELLGLGGFSSGRHEVSAVALADSDVCLMPQARIEEAARKFPLFQRRLHAALAGDIVRGHGMLLLLGSMSGEERLAAFLVNLSRRLLDRGYSGTSFLLCMTREEIGSYLGLKLETVSRLFTALHRQGLISVEHKQIAILDLERLERKLAPGD